MNAPGSQATRAAGHSWHSTDSIANAAQTLTVRVGDAEVAYRSIGAASGVPLVLFNRFRGMMDEWDPSFLDALAAGRRVIIFDSAGVGRSTGETPSSVPLMAKFAVDFIAALGLRHVDALGWSMGGVVALTATHQNPDLVRRVVVAGSSPGGVPNAPATAAKVWEVAGKPTNSADDFLYLFFPETDAGREAGTAHLARLRARSEPASPPVKPESWKAQFMAMGALRGPDGLYSKLHEIRQPALFANGVHDIMVPAYNSYAAVERAPDASLILYPASGHGFLFQYADQFAADVNRFLGDPNA